MDLASDVSRWPVVQSICAFVLQVTFDGDSCFAMFVSIGPVLVSKTKNCSPMLALHPLKMYAEFFSSFLTDLYLWSLFLLSDFSRVFSRLGPRCGSSHPVHHVFSSFLKLNDSPCEYFPLFVRSTSRRTMSFTNPAIRRVGVFFCTRTPICRLLDLVT